MTIIIKTIFMLGPLIFGLGFIAPLTAQIITATGLTPPYGLSPLVTGLIFGGTWCLYAQIRGSWL